jgi:hypothetical protein
MCEQELDLLGSRQFLIADFCKQDKEYWALITWSIYWRTVHKYFPRKILQSKSQFHQQAVLNNIVEKLETAKFHIQESNNRLPASIRCTMKPFIWNPGENIDSNSGIAPRHEQNYPRYVIPQNCSSIRGCQFSSSQSVEGFKIVSVFVYEKSR